MAVLTIHIHSMPKGQPRARHIRDKRTGAVRVVSTASKTHKAYRDHLIAVMKAAAGAQGWKAPTGAVKCSWWAYHPTKHQNRWGLYHRGVPDRDNLDKMIMDCAKKAGIVKDDRQVASGSLEKIWCAPDLQGLVATFEAVEGPPAGQDEDDDVGAFQAAP